MHAHAAQFPTGHRTKSERLHDVQYTLNIIWTSAGHPLNVQTYCERRMDVQFRYCAQWAVPSVLQL